MSTVYIVSKLFTYLILPPGIFILLFFLAAFYAKKFKRFFIFCAFCFYLLSNTIVANFLLQPLEKPYEKGFSKDVQANGVVVLGGGNIIGSKNLSLTSDAYKRVMYGLMIAKSQNLPLVFSGGGLGNQESESASFLRCLREMKKNLAFDFTFSKKIEKRKFSILVEDKSIDSFQNAKFTKAKFSKMGIKNPIVYLVTSAYHMRRAVELYRHFGFKVIPSATDFKISKKETIFWDYFPQMDAFYHSYEALHEYAGLLSLKLRDL
ncbi:MAG: YdcF family protein [Sulfurospirillum sp.]